MADRAINFRGPEIRPLLAGTKTQVRLVIKPQPGAGYNLSVAPFIEDAPAGFSGRHLIVKDPFGFPSIFAKMPWAVGDRLWVREAFYLTDDGEYEAAVYAADADDVEEHRKKIAEMQKAYGLADSWAAPHLRRRSSSQMPRWASRTTLVVTDVRVMRLQDISEADAAAEGVRPAPGGMWSGAEGQAGACPHAAYALLWNHINGPGSWAQNPWVTATTFTPHLCNIDNMEPDNG